MESTSAGSGSLRRLLDAAEDASPVPSVGGMAVTQAKCRLRGKQPKLSLRQETHLAQLRRGSEHTVSELEALFAVTRSTVYWAVARAGECSAGQAVHP